MHVALWASCSFFSGSRALTEYLIWTLKTVITWKNRGRRFLIWQAGGRRGLWMVNYPPLKGWASCMF